MQPELNQEGAISLEQLDEVSFNSNVLAAQLAEAQSLLDELLAGTRIEQIDKQKGIATWVILKLVPKLPASSGVFGCHR